MTLDELDAMFWNRENRRWGTFYYCQSDPRVIAPGKPDWRGYQINFAHRKAKITLALYLTVLVCPVALVFWLGPESLVVQAAFAFIAFAASVTALITLSAFLSRQHTTS